MSSESPSLFSQCPAPITESAHVLLAHGSGGRLSAQLVEKLIVPALGNPVLNQLGDQAVVELGGARLALTTDSYVVTPLFFPGGDIGKLAINGTVNDLAVGGARPRYLSLAFILEEGLELALLERVLRSVREAADAAGVAIVTGDTKVVNRGKGDQMFINTAGVGEVPQGIDLGPHRVQPGDVVLVSGTVGDHGMTILAQRKGLVLDGGLQSDTAPLHGLVAQVLTASPGIHAMRDPTRGGLAATLVEIATRQKLGVEIDEASVPVADAVRGACELLGMDPMLVANEGKLVAFVSPEDADAALEAMRAHPLGRAAARLGTVTSEHPSTVVVRTLVGGRRILDLPFGEVLPRIC